MTRAAVVAAAVTLAVVLATSARGGGSVAFCSAGQLAPVYVNSTGAAGSIDGQYGFRNRGSQRCELTGFPRVQMLKASGRPLSTTERLATGAYGIMVKPVFIAPAAVAYFGIHYASATGYGRRTCPTSAALTLTPPGGTIGLVLHGKGARIQPFGGTIPRLRCGIVDVSALTAKRFQ